MVFFNIGATGRRLGALEDTVRKLELALSELDVNELERMRGSVLNALRSLRRVQQAQDERETAKANGAGQAGEDEVGRLLRIRRGG